VAGEQTTGNLGKVVMDQPYTSFRFLVKMDNEVEASCAFTSFSGIKMDTQLVRARTGEDKRGVKENYPGITEFQNITLKKGVIEKNSFLTWIFDATFPNNTSGPKGDNMYKNLTIVSLTQDGKEGVRWELLQALPVSYELQPMDASQSGVLCETLEFAICGVEREMPKDGVTNQSITYESMLGKSDKEKESIQAVTEEYTKALQKAGKTMEQLMDAQKTARKYDTLSAEQQENKRKEALERWKKQRSENAKKQEEERQERIKRIKQLMDAREAAQKPEEESTEKARKIKQATPEEYDDRRAGEKRENGNPTLS